MEEREYAQMRAVEDTHWWYRALRARAISALRRHATPGGRALDAGCGTGGWLAHGAAPGAIGVDYSPTALTTCRARGLARLARADVTALPFADASFDRITSFDVLYHAQVEDVPHTLQELRRVLRPGGLLVLNLPAYDWLRSAHDRAVHTRHRFTRREVGALLEDGGYDILDLRYWNTLLLPVALLVRDFRRDSDGSDLTLPTTKLNTLLGAVLACELALARAVPMPCGLSVFAVARRPT